MRHRLLALLAGVCVLFPALGVETALADPPSAEQIVGQVAQAQQLAESAAAAAQQATSNGNVAVRVLSPGDDGSVSQENNVSAKSEAKNENETTQDAAQSQPGGEDACGCTEGATGTQSVGQAAQNEQEAKSGALAVQKDATNKNVAVRVLSPGNDGDVSQKHDVSAESKAKNDNETSQHAAGTDGGSGSTGVQAGGQVAKNDQDAKSAALAVQKGASNQNISVRVLSPGDDGSVTQENSVSAKSEAKNDNETTQTAGQTHGDGKDSCRCSKGGTDVQGAGQLAENEQAAASGAIAIQKGASNKNVSVRVLSPGDDGSVTQENSVSADSKAKNENETNQDAAQIGGGGGPGSTGIQAGGQLAKNDQDAASLAFAFQSGASNLSVPVRVLSWDGGGSVSQTNDVSAESEAKNENETTQNATQTQTGSDRCGCQAGETRVPVIGQAALSHQHAASIALAAQLGEKKSRCECRPDDDKRDGAQAGKWQEPAGPARRPIGGDASD